MSNLPQHVCVRGGGEGGGCLRVVSVCMCAYPPHRVLFKALTAFLRIGAVKLIIIERYYCYYHYYCSYIVSGESQSPTSPLSPGDDEQVWSIAHLDFFLCVAGSNGACMGRSGSLGTPHTGSVATGTPQLKAAAHRRSTWVGQNLVTIPCAFRLHGKV